MRSIHFQHEGARAKLEFWEMGLGFVKSVYSHNRGQGHARNVMQQVVDYADQNDLILLLEVNRFGNHDGKELTNPQLERFYSTFGFKPQPEFRHPTRMIRHPERKDNHASSPGNSEANQHRKGIWSC